MTSQVSGAPGVETLPSLQQYKADYAGSRGAPVRFEALD